MCSGNISIARVFDTLPLLEMNVIRGILMDILASRDTT